MPRPPILDALRDALVAAALPRSCSVYVRGSRLEEEVPHVRADLDLVVVADTVDDKRRSWEVLRPWAQAQPWDVDLMGHLTTEVEATPEFRLLLSTRACRVLGPARRWAPVPADQATMRAHARRYGPRMIRSPLVGLRRERVCALKLLTRTFGVWAFDEGLPFSRDIATCVAYAEALASDAGEQLRAAWACVDADVPIDVSDVRRALLDGCRFVRTAPP